MDENVIHGDIARSDPSYIPKKRMPKGVKIALIVVSIILVFAIIFGLLGATVLGFFGIVIALIVYLVTPENDGTFEYYENDGTVSIYGLVDTELEGALYIPEYINGMPVTEIDSYAFSCCYNVTEVYIPDTVIYIGDSAFNHCESLREVDLGNGVEIIESFAFADCTALEEVHTSSSLSEIRSYAFYGCSNLETVKLPASVSLIEPYAFNDCSSLREASFEDTYGWCVEYDGETESIEPDRLGAIWAAVLLSITYDKYTWIKNGAE